MGLYNPTPFISTQASATNAITTTSTSDILMTNMQLAGLSGGQYLVWFSSSFTHNTNNADVAITIYAGGIQQANTVRVVRPQIQGGLTPALNITLTASTNGLVAINNGDAIEIRWQTTSGTASTGSRCLNILKVGF